jgi:hypothetical protein
MAEKAAVMRTVLALSLVVQSLACTSAERVDAPSLLVLSGATLIDGTGRNRPPTPKWSSPAIGS